MSSLKTLRAVRNMERDLNLSERDIYCDDLSPEKVVSDSAVETYSTGFKKTGEIFYDKDKMEITIVENEDLPIYLAGLWFNRNY